MQTSSLSGIATDLFSGCLLSTDGRVVKRAKLTAFVAVEFCTSLPHISSPTPARDPKVRVIILSKALLRNEKKYLVHRKFQTLPTLRKFTGN